MFWNPDAGPRLDRDEKATELFDATDGAGRGVWMVTERAAGAVFGRTARAEARGRIALRGVAGAPGRGVAGAGVNGCAPAIAELAGLVPARPEQGCGVGERPDPHNRLNTQKPHQPETPPASGVSGC